MFLTFIIKGKNGRDLKGFNDTEAEVLFGRNTTFKINSLKFEQGRVLVDMEEDSNE